MRMNQTYTAPTKKETICVTLNFVREQFHCRGDSIKEYNFGKKKITSYINMFFQLKVER